MGIWSCKGCVPPKRHTACWGHCPEYLAEKAEHDRLMAKYEKERNISDAIYANRSKRVYKALRDREKAKKAKG